MPQSYPTAWHPADPAPRTRTQINLFRHSVRANTPWVAAQLFLFRVRTVAAARVRSRAVWAFPVLHPLARFWAAGAADRPGQRSVAERRRPRRPAGAASRPGA